MYENTRQPEELLCYEYGPHGNEPNVKKRVVPRDEMPQDARELSVIPGKRVCDVTAEVY